MMEKQSVESIIDRYLNNSISENEMEILRQWLDEDTANLEYLFLRKNLHDGLNPSFDAQSVDVEKALLMVYENMLPRRNVGENNFVDMFRKIAAILLLPVFVLGAYYYMKDHQRGGSEEYMCYQTIVSPGGMRSQVMLPDSSVAWLNSKSSIRFVSNPQANPREVYMDGEVYFEVKSNIDNPFHVIANGNRITATGTSFSVDAYSSDSLLAVSLVEGKVDVMINNISQTLQPNNRLVYNTNTKNTSIYEGDIYKWIAWKDGILAFRNDCLADVFRTLSRFYNVEFVINDKEINDYTYRATFEDESIDQILNLLELSAPIKYNFLKTKDNNDPNHGKRIIEIRKE